MSVRRFTGAVSVTGLGVLLVVLAHAGRLVPPGAALYVILLGPAVVLGELLPLKIPRRGDDEEITISTTFVFALLLAGGLPLTLLIQGAASAVQDIWARKPAWRVAFNVGQYTLSLAAAAAVIHNVRAGLGIAHVVPLSPHELPAVAVGGAAFLLVNMGLVGVAVALHLGRNPLRYFREDLSFSIYTGAVLLCLSPAVLAMLQFSPVIFPVCLLPIVAIYQGCRQAARSEYEATHDLLTGLSNRPRLRQRLERAVEHGEPFAVLLMDLNRFKEINDTLGHHHGDLLLQQVGRRLTDAIRADDEVGRLGGDEFVVIVRGGALASDATAVADRVAVALRQPFDLEELEVEVDASIGIACYPTDGDDPQTLLRHADVAMYQAKRGHAPHATYASEHDHHTPARLLLAADLRRAIDGRELVPFYQAQLDLASGTVGAAEALVRWRHPTLGLLSPAAFLDVAENTGLIRGLTLRMLDAALEDRQRWSEEGTDLVVAVNVSVRNLLDRSFPAEVGRHLVAHQTLPDRLKLELTESAIMADPDTAREILDELAAMGVDLAIDDFGTGYSSLAYLQRLPVRELKIDRSFVAEIDSNAGDGVIVRSTIELGHNLGLRVIAEGIESDRGLQELRRLGCDGVQGYHLSRPLPADRIVAVARELGLPPAPRLLRPQVA
jgi:diguanylate cyclase (GGDEF)-like protein